MGRPTKLTPEVVEAVVTAISLGNYYEAAAGAGGISYSTFRSWITRGEEELARLEDDPKAKPRKSEEPYLQFLEEVTRAEAEAEAVMVAHWRGAMPQDWRAARDFLARRFPERWGNKETHRHEGELTIDKVYRGVDPEDV